MSPRRWAAAAAVVLVGACASGQDPGLEQGPAADRGSTTTPQFLQACPPGGPDATTPPAGCVDEDGNVRH
jgi:hypothetical protein